MVLKRARQQAEDKNSHSVIAVEPRSSGTALPLSLESKAAIERAISEAGSSQAVTIEHLKTALENRHGIQ
jgi:hypothetical protein